MNTNLLFTVRRQLVVLAIAAFLAVTAAYAPLALDATAGTSLTPASFACSHPTGEC